MALDPRTPAEIAEDLETSLRGKIVKLTNFLDGSFNDTWITAYSDQIHDLERRLLVAQLSGWVRYAGKAPLDQTDLDRLGVDGVEPGDLTEYVEDDHLDELAYIVGIERDPGNRATGEVEIETASTNTEINEGLEVATELDSDGEYLSFFVDADGDGEITPEEDISTTPSSGTTATVDIIAEEVGDEYNVGANTVVRFINPDPGVESVTNPNEVTGGSNEQSNESFRDDIQNAVFSSSGGGTVAGIEGFIEDNVEGVQDVALEEFTSVQPPYVDVIVDGGSEQDVLDAIADSRPAGIEHNLVDPENINLGASIDIIGSDVETGPVQDNIADYFSGLSLDDRFRRTKLVQIIMNTDTDIDEVSSMNIMILGVNDEGHTYSSGTDIYELDFDPLGNVERDEHLYRDGTDIYDLEFDDINDGSVTVEADVNGEWTELTNDTDYDVIDNGGGGGLDAIDFSLGGDSPDDFTVFTVEYNHEAWTIESTITDENGTTYDQGVDWQLVDDDGDGRQDSIDWSIGGSSPADGVFWTISYDPDTIILDNLAVSQREKIGDAGQIDIETFIQ